MSETSPNVVKNATVVITGAAHGMGELYARRAVREGATAVALWDVDREGAEKLARELNSPRCTVRAYIVDVSDGAEVSAAAQQTRAELGEATILINNAGIVRGGQFVEQDPVKDIEMTMAINAIAPMLITREFLPAMIADRSRNHRILNIASAAGTLANPGMSVYAASKWSMLGWSDSVRLEMEKNGYSHIAVTTFCPSYVSTGMFDGARGPLLTPIMTPEQAVDAAWNGMVEGQPLVLRPWTVKLSMALRGALPTRVWDVLAVRVFKVYSSMDHFKGHDGN